MRRTLLALVLLAVTAAPASAATLTLKVRAINCYGEKIPVRGALKDAPAVAGQAVELLEDLHPFGAPKVIATATTAQDGTFRFRPTAVRRARYAVRLAADPSVTSPARLAGVTTSVRNAFKTLPESDGRWSLTSTLSYPPGLKVAGRRVSVYYLRFNAPRLRRGGRTRIVETAPGRAGWYLKTPRIGKTRLWIFCYTEPKGFGARSLTVPHCGRRSIPVRTLVRTGMLTKAALPHSRRR